MPIPSIRRVAVATSVAALLTVPSAAAAAPADPSARVAAPAAPHAVYPPLPGALVLSSTLLSAGELVSFVVEGFLPFELVTVELVPSGFERDGGDGGGDGDGGPQQNGGVLGTFQADADEVVRGSVRIPCDTAPGSYLFTVTGQTSGFVASVPVTVTRSHHEGPDSSGAGGCKEGKGTAAKSLDARPAAHQGAQPESGAGERRALAGVVAALVALGGTRWVLRHRRSSAQRG